MNTDRIQWVALFSAGALVVVALELARRRRFSETDSMLWMAGAFVIFAIAAAREGLEWLAAALGVVYAPSVLFLAGLAAVVFLLVYLSARLYRQERRFQRLVQEHALLRAEVDVLRNERVPPTLVEYRAG